jgi:hypothetical protein
MIITNELKHIYEINNNNIFVINQIIPDNIQLNYNNYYDSQTIILRHKLYNNKSIADMIIDIITSGIILSKTNFCKIINDFYNLLWETRAKNKKELINIIINTNNNIIKNFIEWLKNFFIKYNEILDNKNNSYENYCNYIAYLWIYNKVINFDKNINSILKLVGIEINMEIKLDIDLSIVQKKPIKNEEEEDEDEDDEDARSEDSEDEQQDENEDKICLFIMNEFIDVYINNSIKIYDPSFSIENPNFGFFKDDGLVLGYYDKDNNTLKLNNKYFKQIKNILRSFNKYKEKFVLIIRNNNNYKELFSGLHLTTLLHELEHYRRQINHSSSNLCSVGGSHDSILLNIDGKEIEHSFNDCIKYFYKLARQNNLLDEWYERIIERIESSNLDKECKL